MNLYIKQHFDYFRQCSLRDLVPLLTPAVDKNTCYPNWNLLKLRVLAVGLSSISCPVPFIFYLWVNPSGGFLENKVAMVVVAELVGLVTAVAIPFFDEKLAISFAEMKAVDEYLLLGTPPSLSASFQILSNYKLLKFFINKNGDVNKLNREGGRLVDYISVGKCDLKSFNLLLNNGADVKIKNGFNFSTFQLAVMHNDPIYLQRILNTNRINVNDFTQHEQEILLMCAECVEARELLINFGFKVEPIDSKVVTPPLIPGSPA